MATATIPLPGPTAFVPEAGNVYRLTVEQYVHMVERGVLGPEDHVELLEGWLVHKMSRNPPRDSTLARLNRLLVRSVPDEWVIGNQSALLLARSVPEPDFAIVRGPLKRYDQQHPRSAAVALLIEVADSSRLTDRRQKGVWYAEAKIPEFWLVNLVEQIVEVYTQPRGGKSPTFRQRRDFRREEEVPLVLGGEEVARLAVSNICPVAT
ncbi:MAG: Uma2 family endonuclease [Gemmataceae bacterium]